MVQTEQSVCPECGRECHRWEISAVDFFPDRFMCADCHEHDPREIIATIENNARYEYRPSGSRS